MEWASEKPVFTKDCVLVTANLIKGYWEYTAWIIKWMDGYWGWLTGDGDEYGDIEDLRADKYCVLQEPKK